MFLECDLSRIHISNAVIENCIFKNNLFVGTTPTESKIRESIFVGEPEKPLLKANEEKNVIWKITPPIND